MTKTAKKKIVERRISDLKPHPLNAEIYRSRPDWEIDELAADMEKNGQGEDVEILPDGTIISGHGRVEAAKRLGWKKIRCWVRDDLAAAGPEAVEARLIEANLHRRHLSMLDMARSYRHLKQNAKDRQGVKASDSKVKGDLRDLIAKRFGKSGRTLDRWLKVLDLPLTLQQAVDDGKLLLTVAVKVASLDGRERNKIAALIEAGESPAEVIAPYLRHQGQIDNRDREVRRMLAAVDRCQIEFASQTSKVKATALDDRPEKLRKASKFFIDIATRMERSRKKRKQRMEVSTQRLVGSNGHDEEE